MSILQGIQTISFACCLLLAVLVSILPRFGPVSRRLLLFLLPAAVSPAVSALAPGFFGMRAEESSRVAFALIMLATAGGYFASCALGRQDYQRTMKGTRLLIASTWICAAVLSAWLILARTPDRAVWLPAGHVVIGLPGYVSALYLLVVSVMILASLEQILRGAEEVIRWELKFLVLGMGASFAAVIYVASNILLYRPRYALLSPDSLALFHTIVLVCCGLMAVSWKRSSGRARMVVSHGMIYSSITLLSVGTYLIVFGFLARWASQYGSIGLPIEALTFLISTMVLAAVLLGTAFRHRVRSWVRRNIFSGRYDYRQFWLEATERVRSIDPPHIAAAAVGEIIQKALGAIDVTVWIRRRNPGRLQLLSFLGEIAVPLGNEISGVIEEISAITEPVSVADAGIQVDSPVFRRFLKTTRASLIVPLLSNNQIVGIITVGPDCSGRSYDWAAREFLRVLGGHVAGELHKSELLAASVDAKEDEAFRAFSSFVLHDLKNFASTLSLIAQNAPRHQNNPDFQKDAFQSVYDTAEKMRRLCSSLRTFSCTLASNKRLENLNSLVHSVADGLNAGLWKHLRFELGDLPPVQVDHDELERVFRNLLLNAREAISPDGIITVRSACRDEAVEVSVEDDGRGMSREFIEKELFVPFHTTKSEGLGIGLFQSKKIIEAHRGSILVESEEGKGTIVRLTIPVSAAVTENLVESEALSSPR